MKISLRLATCFLILAGLLALLRLKQASLVIPGGSLRFTDTHSIRWDSSTRMINRTGDDPYVWVELPATSIPIQEVQIEFGGPVVEGRSRFYIYQYPAYLNGVMLNDSYATTGESHVTSDGFTIHWKLANSKILRLDLPDDLDRPVEIRRVTIISGFYGSWAVTLMWILLLAGLLLPLAQGLPVAVQRQPWIEPALVLILIAIKLILASDLKLAVLGFANHDDALFVAQADTIMRGHWLGKFGELTLAKGPVYALFLAGVGLSGAPLLLTQAVFHALACFIFVQALRPLLPGVNGRLLLLMILLFDPHTFSSEAVGRVLRSGIQPALTLLAIAGAIGLAARMRQSLRCQLSWSVFAGVALPFFWFSREEGIWLIPSLLLILGAALAAVLRESGRDRWWRLGLLALPMLLFFSACWLLRTVNDIYYHAPISVDVKDGAFPRAYGALMRLIPAQRNPSVPVSRETRLRAYAVSPAFAVLRPYLEGAVGNGWEQLSRTADATQPADHEIRGGWFQWALREAAAKAGYYHNAATADAYWAQVAKEINAACDEQRIAAGPARTGFYPRWDDALWAPFRTSFVGAAEVTVQFSDFSVQFPPMWSTPDQARLFARVTHEGAVPEFVPPTARTHARMMIHHVYRWCGVAATLVGLLAASLAALLAWRSRSHALEIAFLFALLGGALALMIVSTLVDVTSFSALHAMYLAPATPLVLAAWVLAPLWAWRFLRGAAQS